MSDFTSEVRDGMRIDWDVPYHTHDERQPLVPGDHNNPRDRPAAIFGKRVTLHGGPTRPAHVLLPIIPSAAR